MLMDTARIDCADVKSKNLGVYSLFQEIVINLEAGTRTWPTPAQPSAAKVCYADFWVQGKGENPETQRKSPLQSDLSSEISQVARF